MKKKSSTSRVTKQKTPKTISKKRKSISGSKKTKVKKNIKEKKTVKKPLKTLKPNKKNTLKKPQPFSLPRSIAVSKVLNNFLLPEKFDVFAVNTARFSGMFFIVIGAIFSIFYIIQLPQVLALLGSTPQVAQTCPHEICNITIQADYQPDVLFTVPENILSGTVTILISVENAEAIKMMAYNKDNDSSVVLGPAILQSIGQWQYDWDTTKFRDGTYVIGALIGNQYGTYSANNPTTSTVLNSTSTTQQETTPAPLSPVQPEATTTKSTTAPHTNPTDTQKRNNANLTFTYNSSRYQLSAFVSGENIDKVDFYLHQDNVERTLLEEVTSTSNHKWLLEYDLSETGEGEYVLQGDVTYNDNTLETLQSSVFKIAKKHDTSAPEITDIKNSSSTQTNDLHPILPPTTQESVVLTPEVKIRIPDREELKGIVDVNIEVDGAKSIELYSTSLQSLTSKYIGTAKQLADNKWVVPFDTRNTPNGKYSLYTSVINEFGAYVSNKVEITVTNPVFKKEQSDAETERVDKLKEAGDDIASETTVASTSESDSTVNEAPSNDLTNRTEEDSTKVEASTDSKETNDIIESERQAEIKSTNESKKTKENKEPKKEAIAEASDTEILYKTYDAEYQQLTTSIRSGDKTQIKNSTERLDKLQNELQQSNYSEEVVSDLIKTIKNAKEKAQKDVARTNKIIKERTKEAASTDSDKDGIPDFDEVTIYNTDPYVADTDGDGFNDGAEVLNGFNPTDPTPETAVVYESPKETGIVRSDLLKIKGITSNDKTEQKPVRENFISGVALPNSFVTLYIYSVPTIVTVKTEDDGSFVYKFDKELADGNHEIYIGVTDNTGEIVAKSKPFKFVKKAQAFTPVDAANEINSTNSDSSSFITGRMLLVLLSFAVVTVGIVLILVGLYLDALPKRKPVLINDEADSP